jgi:peroxiredoxin
MTTALLFALLAAAPNVGETAPDFTVKDTEGHELTLSKLVEHGPVVLAFFPKAFTGGCTRELTAYRDQFADIEKHHATVIAISTDDTETQVKFKTQLKAPYSFIADSDAVLVKKYDTKVPVLTLSKRITFVIGPGRKVLSKQEGGDAVDPSAAVQACSLAAAESMKFITGADAGAR